MAELKESKEYQELHKKIDLVKLWGKAYEKDAAGNILKIISKPGAKVKVKTLAQMSSAYRAKMDERKKIEAEERAKQADKAKVKALINERVQEIAKAQLIAEGILTKEGGLK